MDAPPHIQEPMDASVMSMRERDDDEAEAEDADEDEDDDKDEDEDEDESEPESESESATEEEEKEPSALVSSLMRTIFHEYAGSGRVGIERSEIVSMVKSKVKNPLTKYHDALENNNRFNIIIIQAILRACHAPVYALYKTGSFDHFNAYKGAVRELDLLKVLPKKTRDERFTAQLIKDVHFIALADYLGVFIECSYEDEQLANEEIMDEYVLKNAHKFAVVGLPRSNYDTFDNADYPQCDQQSRIVRVFD